MGKSKKTLALIGSGFIAYEALKHSPTLMNYMEKILPYAKQVVEKTAEEAPKYIDKVV